MRRTPSSSRAAGFAVLALGLAIRCGGGEVTGAGRDRVPEGSWGGEHIGLEVTTKGASVDYDCAHGAVDQPMTLDKNGRFDVKGTHIRERPGPVREGDETASRPARYEGRTDGRTMTLTVTLTDTGERFGSYSLTYKQARRVTKCL